ncbi:hypothetical protein Q4Q35_06730 [Flavivirga aquimarina]|uniref:Uncharacterized protein n=1 Tax=Flavivirga aquimarina TaxID=2027862 RepID=A0ABT8W8Q9_9FLAO|nr:hypothetical protein [Flavivirga aquimarina]MDO5969495.1 hypothetical protein [Flavivirga aquimarina]
MNEILVNIREELVLCENEKNVNFVLFCNAKPISDLVLDEEDLGNKKFYKKIRLTKIDFIENLTKDVIKLILRFPPTQILNLFRGNM